MSLASSLQEYLNDPHFEQNRIEYQVTKEAADKNEKNRIGGSSSSAPKSGSTSIASPPPPESSARKEETQAIPDLFNSIEEQQPEPPRGQLVSAFAFHQLVSC